MDTQDKNTKNNQSNQNNTDSADWKGKINDLVNTCQSELKKTTKIGMKMISASQSNTQLHEGYESLGKWLFQEVEAGSISIDNEDILKVISKIKELEVQLKDYEQEVQDIKKGE